MAGRSHFADENTLGWALGEKQRPSTVVAKKQSWATWAGIEAEDRT